MKRYLLSLLVFSVFFNTRSAAQSLAINTDGSSANASALLDVKSTTKGILIPRMTKTEKNAIASPATGLLIYQTGPDSIGFHYYDGTRWSPVLSNSNSDLLAWRTGGNTGTVDGSHYIGTTDDVPLNIKVNNQKAGRIASTGETFFGYQAGNVSASGANTGIGAQALLSNSTGINNTSVGFAALRDNTIGSNNTAIGYAALLSNTTGNENLALGTDALRSNISGTKNTALSGGSLYSNSSGNENIAIGYFSLFSNSTGSQNVSVGEGSSVSNTTGGGNTVLGFHSLYSNSTGSGNTSLGLDAGVFSTGDNNVFLGRQAGYNETGSNKLYIANNNTNPPLIYGDFSTKTLGFGTITPNSTYGFAKVEIASEGFGAPTDLLIRNAATSAGYAPGLVFQHARGTLAAPVTVNNGDYLAALSTMNYDGASYILSAGLDIFADGAIAAGIVPTRLHFNTMNTAGGYAARLTIRNDGKTGIATTAPAATLDVNGDFKLGAAGVVHTALLRTTASINLPSIAANSESDITVTVTGASTTASCVFVSPAADIESGLVIAWARVSAANTVKIRFRNETGSAIDPAAVNYVVSVLQ